MLIILNITNQGTKCKQFVNFNLQKVNKKNFKNLLTNRLFCGIIYTSKGENKSQTKEKEVKKNEVLQVHIRRWYNGIRGKAQHGREKSRRA